MLRTTLWNNTATYGLNFHEKPHKLVLWLETPVQSGIGIRRPLINSFGIHVECTLARLAIPLGALFHVK